MYVPLSFKSLFVKNIRFGSVAFIFLGIGILVEATDQLTRYYTG